MTSEQVHTLRGTYTSLTSLVTYLTAHKPHVRPEDEAAIDNLINFATLNISRLTEHFDTVAEWEQKGRQS